MNYKGKVTIDVGAFQYLRMIKISTKLLNTFVWRTALAGMFDEHSPCKIFKHIHVAVNCLVWLSFRYMAKVGGANTIVWSARAGISMTKAWTDRPAEIPL